MQDHIEKSVTLVSSWKCWLEDVLCCKIHLIFYFCPLKNEQVLRENSQWFKFWLKGFAARLVRRRINQHTFFSFSTCPLFHILIPRLLPKKVITLYSPAVSFKRRRISLGRKHFNAWKVLPSEISWNQKTVVVFNVRKLFQFEKNSLSAGGRLLLIFFHPIIKYLTHLNALKN